MTKYGKKQLVSFLNIYYMQSMQSLKFSPQFTEYSPLKWPKQLWMVLIHVSGTPGRIYLISLVSDCTLFRFASGYGNMNHLGDVHISPLDAPIISGIIAAIVQCFFAYRIFILRRSYIWICILIVLVRSMHGTTLMPSRKLTKKYLA